MFEEGIKLKAEHGAENVFDFSLGAPNEKPPAIFHETLVKIAQESSAAQHAYMPNVGYPDVRENLAKYLTKEQGIELTADEIIMTCGAAGALNVIMKSILEPGEEVIALVPYFVEYKFYVDNHGGKLVEVKTNEDFTPNIEEIEKNITSKTKAVLLNFPNNPTGQVYSKEDLEKVGDLLRRKMKEYGKTIYLISDEPYRKLVFDNFEVPSVMQAYEESIVATSYSKGLSIPGERIGFLAIHPKATYKKDLFDAMALVNRILGFVNAPAIMQRVIGEIPHLSVETANYKRRRDLICDGLKEAGYEFTKPKGAFYLFPKCPIEDDVQFVRELQKELILVVPGSGFGAPGHFRISFGVEDETIINALPGFKRTIERLKG
jgi:aspartate aminotransferase